MTDLEFEVISDDLLEEESALIAEENQAMYNRIVYLENEHKTVFPVSVIGCYEHIW